MPASTLIELYGYLGSTLVVVSMLMPSLVKLRVINTVGSIISGSYALIIGSFPLALMNICLIVINLYNLRKLTATKQHYELVRCGADDAFLRYFTAHHRADIDIHFPDFDGVTEEMDANWLVMCNGEPAGILLAKDAGDGVLQALVEYTTPAYRDCSIGKYLYSALPDAGVRQVKVAAAVPSHGAYLEKMGYTKTASGYRREL